MDIKAAQAEGQNRAAAWLSQNLQVEQTTEPPSTEQAKPDSQVQTAPPAPQPNDLAKPATPPVPTKPGLADAIRRDRENRQAAQTASTEVNRYKGELETVRKELDALKAQAGATDPFEFLKLRKLTKEQQAIWGQAFLYDLKPEVAPQEFRLEVYKAEQARKEQERAEAEQRAAQEREQQFANEQLNVYGNELLRHIQSSPGSNPESEVWFTEDGPDGQPQLNHRAYAQSLFATANNLARAAQQNGQQADLSPANVARVLEQEVSKRMARRDAKKGGKPLTEQKQSASGQGGELTTETSTVSAEGLRGGAPLPKDMSDEARKARAIAAGWGTK